MQASTAASPLQSAKLTAFAATTDAARCRAFYEGKLGLRVVHENAYMLILDSGGVWLMMQKAPEMTPVPRTVVGWRVRDVDATVKALAAAGVSVEHYPWIKQEDGIAEFPDGSRVAWFNDPDGNIVSVSSASYDA